MNITNAKSYWWVDGGGRSCWRFNGDHGVRAEVTAWSCGGGCVARSGMKVVLSASHCRCSSPVKVMGGCRRREQKWWDVQHKRPNTPSILCSTKIQREHGVWTKMVICYGLVACNSCLFHGWLLLVVMEVVNGGVVICFRGLSKWKWFFVVIVYYGVVWVAHGE